MQSRVHNYAHYVYGRDYVLEPVEQTSTCRAFYMTGHGRGIRPNDYIVLQNDQCTIQYKVEQVDYYCDASNLWIALLTLSN
jgi:MioC protein